MKSSPRPRQGCPGEIWGWVHALPRRRFSGSCPVVETRTTEGGHEGERLDERVSDAALAAVHPDDVTAHAIDLILATGQGRLPVTDPASGRLVGLLTRKDLLQVRAALSRAEIERQAYFARRRKAMRTA